MFRNVPEPKKFVIRHVFNSVAKMADNQYVYGDEIRCFGYALRLCLRCETYVNYILTLECRKIDTINKTRNEWTVKANNIMKLPKYGGKNKIRNLEFHENKQQTTIFSTSYQELLGYYEFPNLTVECHVTINRISEKIEKKKLRNFDESMKEFSDVVLVVGREKFYISKLFLASQSTYFQSLFSGNFSESEESEIELYGLDPQDFQIFLELIYGESLVDDNTVERILIVADYFDSKTAFKRCEEFLINRSKLSPKTKFQVAIQYRFDELTKKCIKEQRRRGIRCPRGASSV